MSSAIFSATLNAPNIARSAASPFGAFSATFAHQYFALSGSFGV